jgi:glycerol-3-phosphate dehydrogenase (NAD(P)+)
MEKVAIVGHGDRFDALAGLLKANGKTPVMWNHDGRGRRRLPKGVELIELEALREHHLIFLSLPINEMRKVARQVGDHITGRHAIVHLARNLEHTSLKTVSELLSEETPTRRMGFLTGPMREEDISQGHAASGVCATVFPEVHELVGEALVSNSFRIYRTHDIVGAELAAAYCRVIAMGCGVLSELGLGHSLQATLFSRGLAEMGRFVAHRGGKERTTFGLAGSGNLFIDITAPGSDDFRIGAAAMRLNKFDRKAVIKEYGSRGTDLLELIESLAALRQNKRLALHLLETCHLMVSAEMGPAAAVQHLMSLPTLDD